MGYVSLQQVLASATGLASYDDGQPRRSKGLWHVFIIMRALVLRQTNPLVLVSYDLTEACVDILGIVLPIDQNSRNVYFEPAATMGSNMFRHREGPRQTILNRIQTGLSGGGSKPNLVAIDQAGLPIQVSLAQGWIANLRAIPGNQELLDERTQDLVSWLFRFGVPRLNGTTASIGVHIGNGVVTARPSLSFDPLPDSNTALSVLLQKFLGITDSELTQLLPNLQSVACDVWQATLPIGLEDLQDPLLACFSAAPAFADVPIENQAITENSAVVEIVPVQADYAVDWSALTAGVLARLAEIPMLGLDDTAVQCIAALRAGKYVILLGPPGTGKTELAGVVCEVAIDCGIPSFTVATATADWSTFETIGGYMPSATSSGTLVFSENVFVESVRTGQWLVVDELNRADIDKAFGELFTLFSGNRVRLSYRIGDKPIILVPPGDDVNLETEHPIYLLADWRMLGTMNTFDKSSLFQMSYAFMRRFAFVDTQIPSNVDYAQLIGDRCEQMLVEPYCTNTQRDQTIALLVALFADDGVGSLRSLGLGVGPAIPLDLIKYTSERYKIDQDRSQESNHFAIILEGLEMYLYPQFEGRNEDHDQILAAITNSLSINPSQLLKTRRILATWTGASLQGLSA